MRVLLIDDHELVWKGTQRLCEGVARATCNTGVLDFAAVRDMDSALALPDRAFDLVLLDYHLPGLSGLKALRAVQAEFEGAVVCVLSAECKSDRIREVLEAGAAGFVPKSYGEVEMSAALELVLHHKTYVPAEFLFAEDLVRDRSADEVRNEDLVLFLHNDLTPRQRQVLKLALQGLPNKIIARQLTIAEGTVKVHLSMVYRALGVRNRVGALCRVLQADAVAALG